MNNKFQFLSMTLKEFLAGWVYIYPIFLWTPCYFHTADASAMYIINSFLPPGPLNFPSTYVQPMLLPSHHLDLKVSSPWHVFTAKAN